MLIPLDKLISTYNLKIRGVIHMGAHLLEEKSFYNSANINNIIWIEGNPSIFEKSKSLLTPFDINHKLYNYIISDQDNQEVEFKITNNGQSSSILELDKHSKYYPSIVVQSIIKGKTKKLKSIITENNINPTQYNFLNIDLQGVELKALRGYEELLNNVDYIYTEVNVGSVYKENDLIDDIDQYLLEYGFVRVETKMTDSEWGDAFYIKNKKHTQIVIHALPAEIEDLTYTCKRLVNSIKFINLNAHSISIYITLNLSAKLTNWDTSEIKKEFFIEKFNDLKDLLSPHIDLKNSRFEIELGDTILGTTAQKRIAIANCNTADIQQFIFLDTDIAFHEQTLNYILSVASQLKGKYIVTPETVKLWDNTWDILTNDKFKTRDYGYQKIHDFRETENQELTNITVSTIENNNFKFACGWFTLYSRELVEFIGIPVSLGHYGPEDTFMMFAGKIAADSKKYDITQYILRGIYISENISNRKNSYSNVLVSKNLKAQFRKTAEENFQSELEKFKQKIYGKQTQ